MKSVEPLICNIALKTQAFPPSGVVTFEKKMLCFVFTRIYNFHLLYLHPEYEKDKLRSDSVSNLVTVHYPYEELLYSLLIVQFYYSWFNIIFKLKGRLLKSCFFIYCIN
jgi:hypothetical protein